jgi:hypothetical protein
MAIIFVTIIQDVPPEFSFCNPGESIFRSLPIINELDLVPLVGTNSSCGDVKIDPVILNPWVIEYSDVEATETATPPEPNYVTIGERFNLSIMACMPESWTGIVLNATLPRINSTFSLVTLNDAYVTFIGSQLLFTTILVGDSE